MQISHSELTENDSDSTLIILHIAFGDGLSDSCKTVIRVSLFGNTSSEMTRDFQQRIHFWFGISQLRSLLGSGQALSSFALGCAGH